MISSKNTFLTSSTVTIYFSARATGDRKSSFFTVPILVHFEVRNNPDLYKGFKAKKLPAPDGPLEEAGFKNGVK